MENVAGNFKGSVAGNAILMSMFAKPVDIDFSHSKIHGAYWYDDVNAHGATATRIYRTLRTLALVYFRKRSDAVFKKHNLLNWAFKMCSDGYMKKHDVCGYFVITEAGKKFMRDYRINKTARDSVEIVRGMA